MGMAVVLIIVAGLPGAGKSTVADRISARLRVPVFSVDPIESAILASGIRRSFETGLAAYLVAERLADEQLKLGLSAIVDAVSPVREARELWRRLADRHGARRIIIECVCEAGVHRRRLEARVRGMYGIPEVTWDDVEHRRREYLLSLIHI